MSKIKLSETGKIEKLKFLSKLDEILCEKIYMCYYPESHDKIWDKTSYIHQEKGYKINIFLSGWDGRYFSFEYGKGIVDIIITIDDSYENYRCNYPANWSDNEKHKFIAKYDRIDLSCRTTKLAISIIPTILEKELICLYEFQGKVDCILYNKIETSNLQIDEIMSGFKNRRISLIRIEEIYKKEIVV